ncbi:MAG: AmmeMemoRadiSam system radical SAM enzyme [Armatimonadetes bacterium]|nr:AmmeMemoRadiSam system radical SAM enzyme [Armatimonadota bacterium]
MRVNGCISRREFLHQTTAGIAVCASAPLLSNQGAAAPAFPEPAVRARYWEPLGNNLVRCKLEPRQCEIGDGERGVCGVRENRGGVYYSVVHSLPSAVNVAPVEETFLHALPGSKTLQIGTAGCNLQCKFCNTWQMSQTRPEEAPFQRLSPQQAIDMAKNQGCKSVCFTYNDPVVCFEYMCDTAALARKNGIKALCHTAGIIHDEPLSDLTKVMDSIVVDLKGTTKAFYKELCGVDADRVYNTAYRVARSNCCLEIASPIITGLNDNKGFVTVMSRWMLQNVGAGVPWQLRRFYPAYQMMDLATTSLITMKEMQEMARSAGLHHVYLCNLARPGDNSILCSKCKEKVVQRIAEGCEILGLKEGKCSQCGQAIKGVWQ